MEEPIENLYFEWLCAKVQYIEVPTPSLTHWELLAQLHGTEFVFLISGDDNRAEDGLDIRREYVIEARPVYDEAWMNAGCSILEMMIFFARRAQFQTDIPSAIWFWKFIENLDLLDFNDASYSQLDVESVLDQFVWRTYDYNGRGGMFPIEHPSKDQREVEIWYQFCEYLVEQEE